jgi:hypothetical protein
MEVIKEVDYYLPLIEVIKNAFPDKYGWELGGYHVAKTAHQGRKSTGGQWSRPDISAFVVNRYEVLQRTEVSLITFEVKDFTRPFNGTQRFDLSAIAETKHQLRKANQSFLLLIVPSDATTYGATIDDGYTTFINVIRKEYIGLYLIAQNKVNDYNEWIVVQEPVYHFRPLHLINQSVVDLFSNEDRFIIKDLCLPKI